MRTRSTFLSGFVFVLPALLIYLLYFILPIPLSGFYSLFRWDGISPHKVFVGLGNWLGVFSDGVFLRSLLNNLELVVFSLLIQLPMGILLALFISSRMKGSRTMKLLFFLPLMFSDVAIGIMWRYIYEPNFGLLNTFLRAVGMGYATTGWLGDPHFAFGAVVATICWQFIPFYMIIFAAAISGIPEELRESAYLDGASPSQAFFRITLPLLSNTIRTAAILSLTGSLKYFGLIYVMTQGGPDHASELLATYMYKQAFTNFRMGYGSTIAMSMFIVSFALTVVLLRLGRRSEVSYA
jgi:raffinose/stachyose/melibiose transport system permease protein